MTSYSINALRKFDEEGKQIVQSFLDENSFAFSKYAREKSIELHGDSRGRVLTSPESVVASFAEDNYRRLVIEEKKRD